MVFFTCNACGQSIKKNRVEKHWKSECPRCEVLSCMDCGKDFYGEEYAAHTSCVSEAEKYQGELFKGDKGGSSKGEKKQQEWLEVLTHFTLPRLHLIPIIIFYFLFLAYQTVGVCWWYFIKNRSIVDENI